MNTQVKRRPRRRRLMWWVLALAVLFVTVFLWLAVTRHGAGFVLSQATGRAPGSFAVGQVDGSLAAGLTLQDVSYANGDWQVRVDRLNVRVRWRGLFSRTLIVENLSLATATLELPPAGDADPQALALPDVELPLRLSVEHAAVDTLNVVREDATTALRSLSFVAALSDGVLSVTSLSVGADAWRVEALGRITPSGDYPLALRVDWSLTEQPWSGSAELSGTLAAVDVIHRLSGAPSIDTRGSVGLLGHVQPTLSLTHVCVAPCEAGALDIPHLEVTQSGALDDYAIALAATLSHAKLPATRVRADGRGSTGGVSLPQIGVSSEAVNFNGGGRLRWSGPPEMALKGRFEALDASRLTAALDGRIDGDIDANGSGPDAFTATLSDVRGTLGGFALAAAARIERRGERVWIQDLNVAVGANRLTGSGGLDGDALRADVTLDAPDLKQVSARFGGNAAGRVQVAGTTAAPLIDARVTATQLSFDELRAGSIDIALATLADGQVEGQARLTQVATAARDLGDLSLAVSGPRDALATDVTWHGGGNRLDLNLLIAAGTERLRGQARRGVLELGTAGTWRLEEAVAFDVAGEAVSVGAHAWRAEAAALVVEALEIAAREARIVARLTDMPLAPLKPLLPRTVELEGRVNAELDLTRTDALWRGGLTWRQTGTRLTVTADAAPIRMNFSVLEIDADLQDDNGAIRFRLVGDNATTGRGDFRVREAAGTTVIDGDADLAMNELAWLGEFVPGIDDLGGALTVDLNAKGPLADLDVGGRVAWQDGRVHLTDLGVRLEDIAIAGEGDAATTIALSGSATSSGGRITALGRIDRLSEPSRRLTLAVKGQDLKVLDWDDRQVFVSPDLAFVLADDGAEVNGAIDVPRAHIVVRDLPPAVVKRSADVRVVGREAQDTMALPVSGEVRVTLGDNVHVQALGLDSALRGELTVTLDPVRPPLFEGRLFLVDGQFKAYGQTLDVQRGNLIFQGPIENPTLDVQATRRIADANGDVLAGVRVTGPASKPLAEVYSEPSLPPTQALSYLLLGRGSFDSEGGEGAALGQAALAMGLSRSSPVATEVAAGLGLDEFQVVGDNLDAAALVAGKQITDDLYVRYTFGVFSNLGVILLRYRLSDRLSLEAGASESQSLDLLYSIEK